ncbi:hypothetical protein BC940DRAFT_338413 [Gongronella butleri]|nr:hypothetical protein BC940DRAFT_338413 [Gongronella butleri]
MADKYKSLKVKDLQDLLQKNGLPHTGKKDELIERLVKHDEQKDQELANLEAELGNLEDYDSSKLNLDDITDSDLLTEGKKDDDAPQAAPTTTESSAPAEKPAPIAKEGSGFTYTPIVFDKKAPTPAKDAASDIEKKIERAKRFGVPLDEKTKASMRAQRFNTSSSTTTTTATAQPDAKHQKNTKQQQQQKKPVHIQKASAAIDPEVLKKRAERFGLPVTASPSAEEEKKRKRAERFGLADSSKKPKTT